MAIKPLLQVSKCNKGNVKNDLYKLAYDLQKKNKMVIYKIYLQIFLDFHVD